ncbi:unannotated protein [freshwater metagenome]|uniref:Unannotated protein n=1 Tax=freshwater metagenome TaxID=449393 RepID=A0A6J7ETV5_9ZZZZ|nr:disulfide bond formation protein DsbA [Actinomycetota bacterium]
MATVVVYADIVCPFAYIGLTRLLQRRAELGRHDVHLRIRSWPLELVNGKPVEAAFIGEEIDEIRPQVADDLFTGFDVQSFPASSLPGLALTALAYAVDDSTGEAVAMELRRLLFEDGVDVADAAVLAAVAERHGLGGVGDTDAVLAEYAEGRASNVVGSPHFFVGDTSIFCPTLDIKRVDGVLQVKVDEDAFEALVATIFS